MTKYKNVVTFLYGPETSYDIDVKNIKSEKVQSILKELEDLGFNHEHVFIKNKSSSKKTKEILKAYCTEHKEITVTYNINLSDVIKLVSAVSSDDSLCILETYKCFDTPEIPKLINGLNMESVLSVIGYKNLIPFTEECITDITIRIKKNVALNLTDFYNNCFITEHEQEEKTQYFKTVHEKELIILRTKHLKILGYPSEKVYHLETYTAFLQTLGYDIYFLN